jgi:thiol:disulfide interchange protein DsbC
MRPNILISILLSLLTEQSIGDTNPPSPSVSDVAEWFSNMNIEGLKALPVHNLKMVKAGGRTFFMSDNGRFVITGTLIDVWNRVAVTELDQIDQIANRVDLSSMKLKIDDLGPATIGTGKAHVVVFVDPRCPYSGDGDCQAVRAWGRAVPDRPGRSYFQGCAGQLGRLAGK